MDGGGNVEAYFMYELFDASTQCIFALDGWQRFIDLLGCATSRVVNEVAEIILFLQLNLSVYVCHTENLLQLRDCDADCPIKRFVYMPTVCGLIDTLNSKRHV